MSLASFDGSAGAMTWLGVGNDDALVPVAGLIGANRRYIEEEIPHIASLMCDDAEVLLDHAEALAIGNGGEEAAAALAGAGSNHVVIDLTRGAAGEKLNAPKERKIGRAYLSHRLTPMTPSQSDLPSHFEAVPEIRRHEGRDAVRDLAAPLLSVGLLPAAVPAMDPGYLAEGLEGDRPGAMVAYESGRPVAYMPYAFRRTDFRPALGPARLGRFPYRQLRLFGYAARGDVCAVPVLDRFLKSLFDSSAWHIAQVFELPMEDRLCEYFAHAPLDPRRYRVVSRVFDTIQVRLDENFESYLRNQFTKKTRYNLKREVRLLEEAAPVAMKVYASPEEAADFLGLAESIAKRTYQWRLGLSTVVATPALAEKMSYLARQGRLRSYMLFIRGVPAAYCYATIRQGELSYDNVGYDPQFAKLNPGKVLLFKILQELHGSRAVPQLEFGRGMAEYKLLFVNSQRRVLDVNVYPRRPYPQFLRLLAAAADLGYQSLRPLVRPWMPVIKRRLRNASRLLLPCLLDAREIISQLSLF